MKKKSTVRNFAIIVFAFLLFTTLTSLLVSCTATTDAPATDSTTGSTSDSSTNATTDNSASTDSAQTAATVTGTVDTLPGTEIMIDVTSDTGGSLSGTIRVDVETIDQNTLDQLQIGDTVVVTYSGIVGTSEPPFIAADTLEIQG